jgi:anaerobic magnesium-protoporphyrin IX monomethyl ester cyclase
MRVLMVYPLPSPSSPQKNCALSMIYPGRAAEGAGHSVEFWDARLDGEKLLWKLVEEADVVAISSLSGFQLGESIKIAKRCKEVYPNKPIIWGGVHVTFQPLQSLRENFVDFVVVGEGEIRFPKLLKAIETGKGFKAIDGVGYKKSSIGFNRCNREELDVFAEEPAEKPGLRLRQIPGVGQIKEIIELHDPNGAYDGGSIFISRRGLAVNLATEYVRAVSTTTSRLFAAAAERNEVIFQISRGCNWSPTSCEFCSVGGQYTQYDPKTGRVSSVYRYIPYELWAEELLAIYKVRPFTFLEPEDENSSRFIKDWRYAELLKKLGIKYHLHLRSDQLKKEDLVAKLAETGCLRIHIGAESGNERVLALMRKNEKVEDHYVAAKLLAKYGIEGVYTWIIGNPGETPAEIMDTLRVSDELRKIHPAGKSRATIYVLMPLPGTISFERAKRDGWPLPTTMEGWTDMSAAYNPNLPRWINNLYFIAGFHHNRYHKTPQNFPGWWRLLIAPFEILTEIRWRLGIKTKNPAFFDYFKLEYFLISKLLSWRSRRSAGQCQKSQIPKLLERLFPGMAGH